MYIRYLEKLAKRQTNLTKFQKVEFSLDIFFDYNI